jgi:hypothetical protein
MEFTMFSPSSSQSLAVGSGHGGLGMAAMANIRILYIYNRYKINIHINIYIISSIYIYICHFIHSTIYVMVFFVILIETIVLPANIPVLDGGLTENRRYWIPQNDLFWET